MFSMRVELDEDEVIGEIKDSRGIKFILNALEIDEYTILDEFYFSDILDEAINRDQAEVESDIVSSSLDILIGEKFNPDIEIDLMRFIKKALENSKDQKKILLGIKNITKFFDWDLIFTKTTTI